MDKNANDQQIHEMFKAADLNGDGRITFEGNLKLIQIIHTYVIPYVINYLFFQNSFTSQMLIL